MNAVEKMSPYAARQALADESIAAGMHSAMQRVLQLRSEASAYPALAWQADLMRKLQINSPLPEQGEDLAQLIDAAFARIETGYCNLAHPLYLGYISPKPLMESVLGDFIASALNQTSGAWRAGPAATQIEHETLHWLREFLTLPSLPAGEIGGIFTSGGSMANLSALKLARDRAIAGSAQDGLVMTSKSSGQALIYMSREGHFSVIKAADMLGLGRASVRLIDTKQDGAIALDILQQRIEEDIAAGHQVLCIIGVAGTSASGAVDDLAALAALAKLYNAWFHIDGAAGLAMAALPEKRHLFVGMESADSIAFDPCKWMFTAFGLGCLFLKQGAQLRASFDVIGHYWQDLEELEYFRHSFYGTRQWRSLGLWLCMRCLGANGYRSLLQTLQENANALRRGLREQGGFELLPNQDMPVVCFRPLCSNAQADAKAEELQGRVNASGKAYLTLLDWQGQTWIRAAFNNYSTTADDVAQLLTMLKPAQN